jgi:hypothetical protein
MKSLMLPALMLLLPASAAAADYNFQVPDKCKGSTGEYLVTGADEAETGEPPVVTITYNAGRNTLTSPVTLGYDERTKLWAAIVALPPLSGGDVYLVTTTYTPFLQSYFAVQSNVSQPFTLPPPSWNNQQILPEATITLTDQSDNKIPYGYLEMAPNFGGSSPYTLQADENALVHIYCFTAYVGGNPATVLDRNHNLLFSTNITFTNSSFETPSSAATAAPPR